MEPIKPNGQRAKNALTLIWIVFAIEMASLISSYFQYDLLRSAQNGAIITLDEANANDYRERMLSFLHLIVYIISGVTFILWFRRAYFNLHQRVPKLSYTDGWAAGAWFVPIVSLYLPYQIMKELYKRTKLLLSENNAEMPVNLSVTPLGIWWTLWIIQSIVSIIVLNVSMSLETIDSFILITIINMVGSILFIPLALVTVKIIKDYKAIEPMLQNMATDENKVEPSNHQL